MLFDRGQPVLGPEQLCRQDRRAGILLLAACAHQMKIRAQCRRSRRRVRQIGQPGNSGLSLARRHGRAAAQIVEPAPGMAVDHGKGGILLAKMQQDRHQRDMLDHIGEISRMIAVAVIHAEMFSSGRP